MDGDQTGQEWLTYGQAGERLGLSVEAVRQRARRRRWRKTRGNDGRILISVPTDRTERPDSTTVRTPEQMNGLSVLHEAVALLGAQLQAERSRADSERSKVEAAERRAVEAARERDRLVVEVEGLRAADQARRAAGRVARIKAAWRGE
jgi:hypothetical protein